MYLLATVEPMHLQSILHIIADCRTSNEAKSGIKDEIINPKILWKGNRIRCMKSAMMPQYKLCMVERKEIYHRFKENRQTIIHIINGAKYSRMLFEGYYVLIPT